MAYLHSILAEKIGVWFEVFFSISCFLNKEQAVILYQKAKVILCSVHQTCQIFYTIALSISDLSDEDLRNIAFFMTVMKPTLPEEPISKKDLLSTISKTDFKTSVRHSTDTIGTLFGGWLIEQKKVLPLAKHIKEYTDFYIDKIWALKSGILKRQKGKK